MTKIIPQINQYSQQLKGQNTPQFQAVDAESIKQGIANNTVLKSVGEEGEKNKNLAWYLTAPVGVGIIYGMNKFNKSCQGEYEKTSLGRLTKFGEDIGTSTVFQSAPVKKASSAYAAVKGFINNRINKSKVLSAMFNTPSLPTNKSVLSMAGGTAAEISGHLATKLEEHTAKGTLHLDKLGLKLDEYKEIIANPHKPENIQKLIDVCKKQGIDGSFEIEKFGKVPFVNKHLSDISFVKKYFGKRENFSEYANKLEALTGTGNLKGKTALGKAMPRQAIRLLESLTQGNTGGKIGILFGAYMVADAIKNTVNAPKGEKGKTFAENMIYLAGWYLTMPFGINLMHKAGGLQYIGMTPKQVEKYREAVNKHNEKVLGKEIGVGFEKAKEGGKIVEKFANKAKWKESKQELEKMLKGDSKWFHRPFKWAAKVLTSGLETLRPYASHATDTALVKTGSFLGKIKYGIKQGGGTIGRFALVAAVIFPFLGKLAAKASHVVFGRPTKSVLDEEKPKPKTAQEAANSAITNTIPKAVPQQNAPATAPQSPQAATPQASTLSGSLVKMYNQNEAVKQSTPAQAVPQQNAVAQDAPQQKAEQGPVRTYIPSSAGVQVQSNINQTGAPDKVNMAFSKADRAEQEAMKYLHG